MRCASESDNTPALPSARAHARLPMTSSSNSRRSHANEAPHSSVRASHGSAGAVAGCRAQMTALMMKINTPRIITNTPNVATKFHMSQPMPDVENWVKAFK